MTISIYTCLLGGFLSFIAIAAKALQQKNTQHNRYALIPVGSYILACSELFTAGLFSLNYINHTWQECLPLALSIGTGGWIGCIAGMFLQGWLVKVLYKEKVKV